MLSVTEIIAMLSPRSPHLHPLHCDLHPSSLSLNTDQAWSEEKASSPSLLVPTSGEQRTKSVTNMLHSSPESSPHQHSIPKIHAIYAVYQAHCERGNCNTQMFHENALHRDSFSV